MSSLVYDTAMRVSSDGAEAEAELRVVNNMLRGGCCRSILMLVVEVVSEYVRVKVECDGIYVCLLKLDQNLISQPKSNRARTKMTHLFFLFRF